MNQVRIPGRRGAPQGPVRLAGDKGYKSPGHPAWLRCHGITAVIPRRKDQGPDDGRHRFDREAYRRRAVVEQCIGWLKELGLLGTRSTSSPSTSSPRSSRL